MQSIEVSEAELQEGKRQCLQCQKPKPLQAFAEQKGKMHVRKQICRECEWFNQDERHRRLASQRKTEQQQQAWKEKKQREWERKVDLRQVYEQHQCDKERWYLQQPDRRCQMCHQLLPASAFSGMASSEGFVLHTRCATCHQEVCTRRQLACCLCQEKTARNDFLSSYDGYALRGDGAWVSLCCQRCETAFRALPAFRQEMHIHACCRRSFPPGQVIYAEIDPETGDIRYIGRTGKPQRRHAQHLSDASPTVARWGTERRVWYTRSNWMYALLEKDLTPSMQILQNIEVSPLVVEWEQRFIWNGVQRGWKLLNGEAMDETLVARTQATRFDFLQVPFELLVQQQFFPSHGLAAFLHKWHSSEFLVE